MPRRAVPEIAHTSLTNHRILARPGEPWPEAAYRQTTPELPDLVHLNPVPGRPDHFPLLSLLDAYSELIDRKPEYRTSYLKVLSELEKSDPNHASVQFALGRRDLDAAAFDQAIGHFQRSLQLDPEQALAYGYLSQALAGRGDLIAAIAASDSALALDPYNTFLRKGLIDRLIAAQQYDRAKTEMEQYLKEFPEDSFMRQMQAIANQ
jgi:tetratricopeptide (TPR) repeat protein